MTISELRIKLLEFDQEAEIVIQDSEEVSTLQAIESFGYVPTSLPRRALAINAAYYDKDR